MHACLACSMLTWTEKFMSPFLLLSLDQQHDRIKLLQAIHHNRLHIIQVNSNEEPKATSYLRHLPSKPRYNTSCSLWVPLDNKFLSYTWVGTLLISPPFYQLELEPEESTKPPAGLQWNWWFCLCSSSIHHFLFQRHAELPSASSLPRCGPPHGNRHFYPRTWG